MLRLPGAWCLVPSALALALLPACSSALDPRLLVATDAGRYAAARVAIDDRLTQDPADRDYILDRLRLLILSLADGQPLAAERAANEAFSLLRTQGLNADRTVASAVLTESVRIWKGEPFEQALAYHYIALQKASLGEWDNARAAAASSLFLLKDFSDSQRSAAPRRAPSRAAEPTARDLAREAARRDTANPGAGDDYLDRGYTPVKTDFALGYLLSALANKALARDDEAADNFREAVLLNPALADTVAALQGSGYNTVFVVDAGRGPQKVAYGEDGAFTTFAPRFPTDARPLALSVAAPGAPPAPPTPAPPVQNINAMAASHRWNNLEDVRAAKSTLGSVLLIGGGAVAVASEDDEARLVGVGVALAGLLMKATSRADTRHVEFLPQRVYVLPASILERDSTVTLDLAGSRLLLAALDPPPPGAPLQLRYVRLPPQGGAAWQTSGQVFYANDHYDAPVRGDTLPYILGGRDVSLPTPAALARYHAAGNLTNLTTSDLENLYREEGIALAPEDGAARARKHILEGGDSLLPPLPGTTGYARLFGQLHPPYEPRGRALKDLRDARGRAALDDAITPQSRRR